MSHDLRKSLFTGLTLVETLTVLVVVLVVSSLMFSTAVLARDRSRVTSDLAKLRQVGNAAQQYGPDYDGAHPLSLRPLLRGGYLPKAVCLSDTDPVPKGYLQFVMDRILRDVDAAQASEKFPRCSFIGPGEGNWTWASFQARTSDGTNVGWLINPVRLRGRGPRWGQIVFPAFGPYQRLRLDGSVIPRFKDAGIGGTTTPTRFVDYFADSVP